MAKEISFSEFLKEGAFQKEEVFVDETVVAEKPIRIEPDAPATDKELKQFWKSVRHFFRTGERPEGVNGMLIPALLAPFLKAGNYTNDYPIFISKDGSQCKSLVNLIEEAFDASFVDDEAKILRANLPRILRDFKAEISREKHYVSFEKAWATAEADLQGVDVHGDKKKLYLEQIEKLKKALPANGFVLPFTDEAAFIMLQIQFENARIKREVLLADVKLKITSIEELLKANSKRKAEVGKGPDEEGLEFAENIINFKKVSEMLPTEGTQGLAEARVIRLKNVVEALKNGLEKWASFDANIIITEALYEEFSWAEILPKANFQRAGVNQGYQFTEDTFDAFIGEYATFIASYRIAALELKDAFKDDVHIDFFGHFSWHRLTADEMQHFPPVLFVGETHGFLKNNLDRFSALLSLNKPIRLMAVEKRLVNAPNPDINWEDASHGYRQELAAIAIAHRSTHTFQCALNQPLEVFEGMKKCLTVDAPSIMHFLIPDHGEVKLTEILKLSAAVEGRFFPSITYDLSAGNTWGSRFDIGYNPQPELNWPKYDCTFIDVDGEQKTQHLEFTYADYKAVTKEKADELMLIPESLKSNDLIHIGAYLQTPVDQLTGKVPFIWLVDEDNVLKRAALPYMWVVSCQERLDNWNYIQELGGVNSYHVKEALQREKAKWEAEKAAEQKAAKAESDAAIALAKSTAANEAMQRLTNVLLGLEDAPVPSAKVAAKPAAPAEKPLAEKAAKPTSAPAAKEKVEEEPSADAWLESFKCTTCNDCTEKFPHIFEYNEDKQAIIKDGQKGKFSELVLAAENCPAKCIHPGAPKNKNEKDLDEFVKRAAKFN